MVFLRVCFKIRTARTDQAGGTPAVPFNFAHLVTLFLVVAAAIIVGASGANAQQQQTPTPTPTPRTGRSYSSGEPRRPAGAAPQAASPVQFTDITVASGITFRHQSSPTSQKYLIETMGGGVALFDYDNDGRLDLYFTNGASIEDPMPRAAIPNKQDPRYWNRLYHQRPDSKFEDVTERAGVQGKGYGMGVATADYNGDGFIDLFVSAYRGSTRSQQWRWDFYGCHKGSRSFDRRYGRQAQDGSITIMTQPTRSLSLHVTWIWDFERGALYCGEPPPGARCLLSSAGTIFPVQRTFYSDKRLTARLKTSLRKPA